jgi:hypothetical protein
MRTHPVNQVGKNLAAKPLQIAGTNGSAIEEVQWACRESLG